MAYSDLLVTNKFDLNCRNLNTSTELVSSTTNSINISTGALVVNGGVGITKDLYVGGSINSSSISNYTVTSFSFPLTGAATGPLTGTFILTNYGTVKQVIMNMDDMTQSYTGTASYIYSSASAVPANFRPLVTDIWVILSTISGGVRSWGLCQITTTGNLVIYHNNETFATSGYNGVAKQSITYFI